jgi:TP901 family phage tail tape measure protein
MVVKLGEVSYEMTITSDKAKAKKDAKELADIYDKALSSVNSNANNISALGDKLKEVSDKVGKSVTALAKLTKAIGGSDVASKDLSTSLNKVNKVVADQKNVLSRVADAQDRFNDELEKTNKSLDGNIRRTAKQSDANGKLEHTLRSLGEALRMLMVMGRHTYDLSKQAGYLDTILSGSSADVMVERLAYLDSAIGSTTDKVKALYEAYSSGLRGSESEMVEFTESVLRVAKATGTTSSQMVNAVTTIMNAYQIDGSNVDMINDQMMQTIKLGKIWGSEYAKSIGMVVNTASEAGISLREMNGAIATLSRTMTPSMAIISLNQAINAFLKPTERAVRVAERLGIELDASALASDGLQESMMKMKEATGGDVSLLSQMFGNIRAVRAISALTGKQSDMYANITDQFYNVEGVADDAFSKIENRFSVTVDKITNDWKDYSAFFVQSFTPLLEVVSKFTSIMAQSSKGSVSTQNNALETTLSLVRKIAAIVVISRASMTGVSAVLANIISKIMYRLTGEKAVTKEQREQLAMETASLSVEKSLNKMDLQELALNRAIAMEQRKALSIKVSSATFEKAMTIETKKQLLLEEMKTKEQAKQASLKKSGTLLNLITNPYVLGAITAYEVMNMLGLVDVLLGKAGNVFGSGEDIEEKAKKALAISKAKEVIKSQLNSGLITEEEYANKLIDLASGELDVAKDIVKENEDLYALTQKREAVLQSMKILSDAEVKNLKTMKDLDKRASVQEKTNGMTASQREEYRLRMEGGSKYDRNADIQKLKRATADHLLSLLKPMTKAGLVDTLDSMPKGLSETIKGNLSYGSKDFWTLKFPDMEWKAGASTKMSMEDMLKAINEIDNLSGPGADFGEAYETLKKVEDKKVAENKALIEKRREENERSKVLTDYRATQEKLRNEKNIKATLLDADAKKFGWTPEQLQSKQVQLSEFMRKKAMKYLAGDSMDKLMDVYANTDLSTQYGRKQAQNIVGMLRSTDNMTDLKGSSINLFEILSDVIKTNLKLSKTDTLSGKSSILENAIKRLQGNFNTMTEAEKVSADGIKIQEEINKLKEEQKDTQIKINDEEERLKQEYVDKSRQLKSSTFSQISSIVSAGANASLRDRTTRSGDVMGISLSAMYETERVMRSAGMGKQYTALADSAESAGYGKDLVSQLLAEEKKQEDLEIQKNQLNELQEIKVELRNLGVDTNDLSV